MIRAQNTNSKRRTTPSRSLFQNAPASVMAPRLMVILSAGALLILGLVMVYSSSSITGYVEKGDALSETFKQCAFALVGIVAAVAIVLFVKQDFLRGIGCQLFWGACVILLVLTALLGTVGLGAKRWLIIGPISIQISEFAKIAFVFMAARIAEEFNDGSIDLMGAVKQAVIYIAAPLIFLFFAQSDLGTTLICCVALVTVLWLSGLPNKYLIGVIVAGVVLVLIAIFGTGYRSDRLIFLDPWSDDKNAGYQLIRAFKAFAYGGFFGVGIGNSYEKLLYLPEAETDFIFAIIGEELGLVGTVLVVVAFIVFLRGGLLIASQAKTPFGGLVAASLTIMVVFQAFLNIACVIGVAPTTGKPLPFISSGGSSLISSLVVVGFILSVSFDTHNEGTYRARRENLHVVSSYSRMSDGDTSLSPSATGARSRYAERRYESDSMQRTYGRQSSSLSLLSSCGESPSLRVIRGEGGVSYEQASRMQRATRR